MFNRMIAAYANLTLTRKLVQSFAVLLFLTLLVSAAALITGIIRENANSEALTQAEDRVLAQAVELHQLAARRREKDFLMRYRNEGVELATENYLIEWNTDVAQAIEATTELLNRTKLEQEASRLKSIRNNLLTYQANYTQVWALIENRGTLLSGGAVGNAKDSLATLAESAESLGSTEVAAAAYFALDGVNRYDILSLPGAVTDDTTESLGHRAEAQQLAETRLDALRSTITRSDLDASARSQLLSELVAAEEAFAVLVELDNAIFAARITGQNAARDVAPDVALIVAGHIAAVEEAQEVYQNTQQLARTIEIGLVLFALAIGVVLAVVTTNLINRQMHTMTELFGEVAIGNFAARATVFAEDDLGQLATNINAMLEQLANLLV